MRASARRPHHRCRPGQGRTIAFMRPRQEPVVPEQARFFSHKKEGASRQLPEALAPNLLLAPGDGALRMQADIDPGGEWPVAVDQAWIGSPSGVQELAVTRPATGGAWSMPGREPRSLVQDEELRPGVRLKILRRRPWKLSRQVIQALQRHRATTSSRALWMKPRFPVHAPRAGAASRWPVA